MHDFSLNESLIMRSLHHKTHSLSFIIQNTCIVGDSFTKCDLIYCSLIIFTKGANNSDHDCQLNLSSSVIDAVELYMFSIDPVT